MKTHDIDSSKAFVTTFKINPNQPGKLNNLTFSVKDNIDIAGFKTSYGSKPWRDNHSSAVSHAVCVEQILYELNNWLMEHDQTLDELNRD